LFPAHCRLSEPDQEKTKQIKYKIRQHNEKNGSKTEHFYGNHPDKVNQPAEYDCADGKKVNGGVELNIGVAAALGAFVLALCLDRPGAQQRQFISAVRTSCFSEFFHFFTLNI
jgi:hypothetical protein